MPSDHASVAMPDLPVVLSLGPDWRSLSEDDSNLQEDLRADLATRLAALVAVLGVPGRPAVSITRLKASEPDEGTGLFLAVNDEACLLTWPILDRAYNFVAGTHEPAPHGPLETEQRLGRIARGPRGGDPLVEYLASACVAVIAGHAELLFGLPQAAAYIASLPAPAVSSTSPIPDGIAASPPMRDAAATGIAHESAIAMEPCPAMLSADDTPAGTLPSFVPTSGSRSGAAFPWPPELAWLMPILRNVLRLGISIAEQQTIADAIHSALAERDSAADVTERLIAALRPAFVEIRLSPATLRQITTDNVDAGPALFPFVRSGVFNQLGVRCPAFRFTPAQDLPPNCFAFTVNHVVTLPWLGLVPDQSLVRAGPWTLEQLGLPAAHARHPGEDAIHPPAYSTVPAAAAATAADAGLATWDQLGYLGLCLAITLREYSACFVDSTVVDEMINQLKEAFPELVKASLDRRSVQQITGLVRALVAHRLPVRNLRFILERLLDYDLQGLTGGDSVSLIDFVEDGLPKPLRNREAMRPSTAKPWWPLFIEQSYAVDRA